MQKVENEVYAKIKGNLFTLEEKETISFEDIYKLVECGTVELIRLPCNIDLWVDEEGNFKKNILTHVFIKGSDPFCISGTGILLTHDEDGYSTGLEPEQVKFIQENVTVSIYGMINP